MNKKAQESIAIFLVVILIIILAAALIIIVLKPGLLLGQSVKETKTTGSETKLVCNYPYIQVGNNCCLDKNNNAICDDDETQAPITPTEELKCQYPYIKKGTACCLDEDSNNVCDNEESNKEIDIRRASLDDPFDISSVSVYRDEISIRIKNVGDQDYVIKNIDVEKCDNKDFDKTIKEDEKKTFSLDCDSDFGKRSRNVDITVEYTEINGNKTLTSDGSIDFRVPSNYYD